MVTYDKGPPARVARHLGVLPDLPEDARSLFWWDWGPVFYRGRLTGRAKLLAIASDPGPSERVAGRTLVGDAGQRVQGLLDKLGLTRGYVLVNAFPVALHPGRATEARPLLSDPDQLRWRNRFYDLVTGPGLETVVAFGSSAQRALDLWDTRPDVPAFRLPQPSASEGDTWLERWRDAIPRLRDLVTPDLDGSPSLPNYGDRFVESDYAPVPRADLPFGLPPWLGDDAWGRRARPQQLDAVTRSESDPGNHLVWRAPTAADLATESTRAQTSGLA